MDTFDQHFFRISIIKIDCRDAIKQDHVAHCFFHFFQRNIALGNRCDCLNAIQPGLLIIGQKALVVTVKMRIDEFSGLMQPVTANYKQFEEQRNNIYRYFGVSEEVVTSKAAGDEWEAFYEAKLEPFLVDLSLELTNKVFTKHERECGNELIFEANRLAYASTATKLAMVQLVDRGAISLNEYRETLNLAPVEGGDIRVIRREYTELSQLGKEEGGTANAD